MFGRGKRCVGPVVTHQAIDHGGSMGTATLRAGWRIMTRAIARRKTS